MREILFRGKRHLDGKWVEGYLDHVDGYDAYTISEYFVDDLTIGQYTGLKDKNGKRIFEGDVIRVDKVGVGVVTFKNAKFRCYIKGYDWLRYWNVEVIGNIHDNKLEDFKNE